MSQVADVVSTEGSAMPGPPVDADGNELEYGAEPQVAPDLSAPEADVTPDPEPKQEPIGEPEASSEEGEVRELKIPTTQAEFDKLTPEERESLEQYQLEQAEQTQPQKTDETDNSNEDHEEGTLEDKASEKDQPDLDDETSSFLEKVQLRQEDLGETPDVVLAKLIEQKEIIDGFGDYAKEDVRQGLETFYNDPVIKNRIDILSGEKEEELVEDFDDILDINLLSRLDFNLNPAASMNAVKRLVQTVHERTLDNVRIKSDRAEAIASYENTLRDAFNDVESKFNLVTKDDNGERVSPLNPSHKMRGFVEWINENSKDINIVKIGGPAAYQAYLANTGKAGDRDKKIAEDARGKLIASLKGKQNAARTLPRSASSAPKAEKNVKHGIDIARYTTDRVYAEAMYDRHSDDPKMREFFESIELNNVS